MKVKRLVKFYFNVEQLEKMLDGKIRNIAEKSADYNKSCEFFADKILEIISDKAELAGLWGFIDKIISSMSAKNVQALRYYARLRTGFNSLSAGVKRGIKTAAVQFTRHARGIERFRQALGVLNKYYCLAADP